MSLRRPGVTAADAADMSGGGLAARIALGATGETASDAPDPETSLQGQIPDRLAWTTPIEGSKNSLGLFPVWWWNGNDPRAGNEASVGTFPSV